MDRQSSQAAAVEAARASGQESSENRAASQDGGRRLRALEVVDLGDFAPMGEAEAAGMRPGRYVRCPHDDPPQRVRRVTAVHHGGSGAYVRIHSLADALLPARELGSVPAGVRWSRDVAAAVRTSAVEA